VRDIDERDAHPRWGLINSFPRNVGFVIAERRHVPSATSIKPCYIFSLSFSHFFFFFFLSTSGRKPVINARSAKARSGRQLVFRVIYSGRNAVELLITRSSIKIIRMCTAYRYISCTFIGASHLLHWQKVVGEISGVENLESLRLRPEAAKRFARVRFLSSVLHACMCMHGYLPTFLPVNR